MTAPSSHIKNNICELDALRRKSLSSNIKYTAVIARISDIIIEKSTIALGFDNLSAAACPSATALSILMPTNKSVKTIAFITYTVITSATSFFVHFCSFNDFPFSAIIFPSVYVYSILL